MKCHLCRPVPAGFHGHAALGPVMDVRPREGMAFACTLCGAVWIRRHAGGGEFSWEAEGGQEARLER